MRLTPEEIRNMTWEGIQERMCGLRHMVYIALGECPEPVTTRQLAANMNVDVLNVRPRVSELVDFGLAEMVGSEGGHRKREGTYRAVPMHQARAAHDARHAVGQNDGVTRWQGDGVTRGQGDGVTRGQGDGVTRGQGDGVTRGQGDGVTRGQGDGVTRGQGDTVTAPPSPTHPLTLSPTHPFTLSHQGVGHD